MGDHRADIKIKFSMYGETETADMWINWSVGSGECYEVDQRVIDFFRDAYLKMRTKYDDEIFKLQEQDVKTLDEHCVFQNNQLVCLRCQGIFSLPLPMDVDDLAKKTKAFIALHKDCKEQA